MYWRSCRGVRSVGTQGLETTYFAYDGLKIRGTASLNLLVLLSLVGQVLVDFIVAEDGRLSFGNLHIGDGCPASLTDRGMEVEQATQLNEEIGRPRFRIRD